MAAPFTLSDLLGYTSIGCWLGAQFPQVVENYRRKSCEGLALPFLANWLMGDVSNLIGCLLTHQLPFQTYLATYFVAVDLTLVAQYAYYYKPTKPIAYGHPRLSAAPGTARRLSLERGASRYRTLSTVAANVAAAAALAAEQEEIQPGSARALRQLSYGTDDLHTGLRSSRVADDDDIDELGVSALADSFHSESGQRLGRKRPAYSIERPGSAHYPRTSSAGALRSMSPEVLPSEPLRQGHRPSTEAEEHEPPTTGRRSSRPGRRGASMVFLGVWALFGIGSFTNGNKGIVSSSTNIGRLLLPQEFFKSTPEAYVPAIVDAAQHADPPTFEHLIPRVEGSFDPQSSLDDNDAPSHPQPAEPDYERVLGRIFAWLCTTLYLTSRLPQIWKNFVRKSVEGLSMYLFVFAFLGNVFYVASILTSPKTQLPPPANSDYIRESIPYLLGSGGTLLFDISIVAQSFLYRPKPKRHLLSTNSRLSISEEEAGLLSGDLHDALHPPLTSGDAAIMNRGRTSRTRSVG